MQDIDFLEQQAVDAAISLHWKEAITLNKKIAEIDPQNQKPYEYQKVDNITYNLCAEFNKYTNSSGKNQILMMNDYNGRSWTHPAGRYCFEQTINQNLYLKPVPLMR